MSMGISQISNHMSFDPAAMFKKLDANSNGGVTKDEFLAGIKKQYGDTDEKLSKLFEKTDNDGDGIISQAENDAMLEKMAKQGPPPPPPSAKGSGKSSASSASSSSSTTYDVKDTNKDGSVSVKEKLEYILKLLQENESSDTVRNEYNRSRKTSTPSGSVNTTFSVKA